MDAQLRVNGVDGSQPLMLRFLRGARRLRPVVHASAPQWDLPLVLEALVSAPFEPLELSSLKALLWKTALLLALYCCWFIKL